jgi:D-alanyl-D-alanine carboxypeptidase
MKHTVKIRKLLCLLGAFLIFIVGNSFIYEWNVHFEPVSVSESPAGQTSVTLTDAAENVEDKETEETENNDASADSDGFSRSDWKLILINKQHHIPDDYTFTLGTIKGSMKCDERIIEELQEMLQAAQKDGISLAIRSPYRDYERQIMLFNRKIKAYMKKKNSYLESYRQAAQAVTIPGSSEHQVGLALDITCDTYTSLNEGFGETQAGKWLAAHSYEYGFILRYPEGKEDVTGIEYEPWHFRYVGKEAAAYMYENELTLEEFVAKLN